MNLTILKLTKKMNLTISHFWLSFVVYMRLVTPNFGIWTKFCMGNPKMAVILGYLPLPWELAHNWPLAVHRPPQDTEDPHFFEGQIRNLHGRLPNLALFLAVEIMYLASYGTNPECTTLWPAPSPVGQMWLFAVNTWFSLNKIHVTPNLNIWTKFCMKNLKMMVNLGYLTPTLGICPSPWKIFK